MGKRVDKRRRDPRRSSLTAEDDRAYVGARASIERWGEIRLDYVYTRIHASERTLRGAIKRATALGLLPEDAPIVPRTRLLSAAQERAEKTLTAIEARVLARLRRSLVRDGGVIHLGWVVDRERLTMMNVRALHVRFVALGLLPADAPTVGYYPILSREKQVTEAERAEWEERTRAVRLAKLAKSARGEGDNLNCAELDLALNERTPPGNR